MPQNPKFDTDDYFIAINPNAKNCNKSWPNRTGLAKGEVSCSIFSRSYCTQYDRLLASYCRLSVHLNVHLWHSALWLKYILQQKCLN